jgi:hypothetical protein
MTLITTQVADKPRECEPTFSLEREIERAKREMGPVRWAQLNSDWNNPSFNASLREERS